MLLLPKRNNRFLQNTLAFLALRFATTDQTGKSSRNSKTLTAYRIFFA